MKEMQKGERKRDKNEGKRRERRGSYLGKGGREEKKMIGGRERERTRGEKGR